MKDEYDRWARFFSGNISEEERVEIQHWIDARIDHQEYAAEIHELWNNLATRNPATQKRDVNASWEGVLERARVEATQPRKGRERPPVRRKKRNPVFRTGIIISTILIPFVLFVLVMEGGQQDKGVITYASEKGERLSIQLNDGSMAYLGVESKLTVPEMFTEGNREIELEGEAYFEVKSDASRPFIVHAGEATVQVLGTEFNVRSYASEERVTLLVAEGRVSFSTRGMSNEEGFLVTAGQRGIYSEEDDMFVEDYQHIDDALGWRDGKLIFNDQSLEEITRELERWYATEFSFQDEQLSQIRITATFDLKGNEPLGNVLDVIRNTANVKCIRGDETVVISR